jgi:hypothetical protein
LIRDHTQVLLLVGLQLRVRQQFRKASDVVRR